MSWRGVSSFVFAGGGAAAPVTSVFSRTGDVTAVGTDYAAFYDALGAAAAGDAAHLLAYNHALLHVRQHALDSTSDHTGIAGTATNFMALSPTGLPIDSGFGAGSFDAAGTAAAAVAGHELTYNHLLLHTRQHAIDSTSDHTGVTGADGNFMALNASGLPKDSGYNGTSFDAAGTASGLMSTHEGTYNHGDIALNTGARHAQQHSITSGTDHTFPGGGTTFLRDDGTFQTVPVTPAGNTLELQYNNAGVLAGTTGITYTAAGQLTLTSGITNTASALLLNDDAGQNVSLFGSAASGETKYLTISGFRASDSLRTLQIGVGIDAADTWSAYFDSVLNAHVGPGNTYLGYYVHRSGTIGSGCTEIGVEAGRGSQGSNNVFLGYRAGRKSATFTAGSRICIGNGSGYNGTNDGGCTFIGAEAGASLAGDLGESFGLGYRSVYGAAGAISVCRVIGVGAETLYGASGLKYDVAIGWRAGYSAAAQYCLYLGEQAGISNTTSNAMFIQMYSINQKPLLYGLFDTGEVHVGFGAGSAYTPPFKISGYPSGASLQTVSMYHSADGKFLFSGVTDVDAFRFDQNLELPSDSKSMYFGGGLDAYLTYDGTDMKLVTDAVAASDFVVDCGTDKTLRLAETVWGDIQFQTSSGKVGAANVPTWRQMTTHTYEYAFDVDDYIDLASNELEHGWAEGTTGNFHLHIATTTAQSTGANRYAQFTIYIAYVNASNVWVETTLTAEWTIPTGTAALYSYFLDMGDVAFTGLKIGTQVKIRVKRIAATGGTEYADEVFVHQCGVHVEFDTIGSRQQAVK